MADETVDEVSRLVRCTTVGLEQCSIQVINNMRVRQKKQQD